MYKMSLLRNIESSNHTTHSQIKKRKPQKPFHNPSTSPQTTLYIMHYQTFIVALFASAAMAKGPWVASFVSDLCTGVSGNDAVSMNNLNCVPFHPVYDSIAINFGGSYQVGSISVFSDSNCKNPAGDDIVADPDFYPQQCLSMRLHGAKWGSVQITPPTSPYANYL